MSRRGSIQVIPNVCFLQSHNQWGTGHTLPNKYPFAPLFLYIEHVFSATHQGWPSGIKTFSSLPHSGRVIRPRSTQGSKVQRGRWDFKEGSWRETVPFVPLVSLAAKLGHERFQKACWDLENGSHVFEWASHIAVEWEPTLDSQTSLMTDWGDLCVFKSLSLSLWSWNSTSDILVQWQIHCGPLSKLFQHFGP